MKISATFILLLALTPAAAAADSGDGIATLHQRIAAVAASIAKQSETPGATIDTRDLGTAALGTLMDNGDPAIAERELDLGLAKQDLVAGSATYGQIPWRTTEPITDLNAAPFFGQALVAITSGYADRLPPSYMPGLKTHIAALLHAILVQPVTVQYTNVYLMRAVDLIVLGHLVGNAGYEAAGRRGLQSWIALTRSVGISEFDTTWYYPVDLSSLHECYRYAPDDALRQTCSVMLRYFYTDIAANYLPAAQKLSSPVSRDYDFVNGNGDLPNWLGALGWSDASATAKSNLLGVYALDAFRAGGYVPPADIRALAFSGPRNVTSSHDGYPGHVHFNWIGDHVSLGCAGGSYGGQDRLLVGSFAGPATQAQFSILIDQNANPIGYSPNGAKPTHVSPALACVEHGGAAVATFEVEPPTIGSVAKGLATNVIFPLNATVTVNGREVHPADGDVPISADAIVAIEVGGGVIAFRATRIDPIAGRPSLTLTTDAHGRERGAAWLSIQNLRPGEPVTPGATLRETFLIVARDDGSVSAASAQLESAARADRLGQDKWIVGASFPAARLVLARSTPNRGAIELGTIDGRPPALSPLEVDGVDYASRIWRELP